MTIPSVLELLQAGVHFGHQKSRWHPKMKPYLFTERGGIYIIDLEKTIEELERATSFVRETVAKGGTVLFIGTKNQGKDIIKKYAMSVGMPYITERWVGGLFTNFSNVGKLIKTYRELKSKIETGELKKYTKKEQSEFGKQLEKLEKLVGGVSTIDRIPEAVFILDAKREKTALTEARTKRVPVIGFADANINPEQLTYPIPANDDAVKSIEIITRLIAEAVAEGKAQRAAASSSQAQHQS